MGPRVEHQLKFLFCIANFFVPKARHRAVCAVHPKVPHNFRENPHKYYSERPFSVTLGESKLRSHLDTPVVN